MRRKYIHDDPDWPGFRWDDGGLAGPLAEIRHRQGRLLGRMEDLGFDLRQEAVLETLTGDVVKSSEIEGERLDGEQVRSSVARRLGMDIGGLRHVDRNVDGVVEMMLDATSNYAQPLTAERLHAWHSSLFPAGQSGMRRITVGAWRDDSAGPMQMVSGPMGRERVHYEAPPAARLDAEMEAFLDRFNAPAETDGVLRAGLAHLWFVTVHPFDDGNGRIARAVADMALARSEGSPQRFYSMSSQIMRERDDYYDILERTQRGTMDVSAWQEWFLVCLGRRRPGNSDDAQAETAFRRARGMRRRGSGRARPACLSTAASGWWWATPSTTGTGWMGSSRSASTACRAQIMRERDDFYDSTTSKWARLAKCSQDTALRDIQDLVGHGIMARSRAGGRSLVGHDLVHGAEKHRAGGVDCYELVSGLAEKQ